MDAREYAAALRRILDATANDTRTRLEHFQRAVQESDGVDGVVIDVFVDQDAEGPFDVWARFDGSDAFALDRRFDGERHLFGVEWGEDGWEPDVPPRPREWTRDDLERAVVDAVVNWISPLLPTGSPEGFWQIGSPDGVGA